MSVRDWNDRGHRKSIDGHEVFFVDEGAGPAIVFLHGYPSSSYDLHLCWDRLTANHRVVAHDHLGFGFSAKPRHWTYSLRDQASLAIELWTQLHVDDVHIVAHDYGQTVAAEVLARRAEGVLPFSVTAVTLCNGSTLVDLASMSILQRLVPRPIIGDLLVRLSNKAIFHRQIRRVLGNKGAVPDSEIDDMFELMTRDGGRAVWSKIARYQDERRAYYDRFVGAFEALRLPCHIVWGQLDAVATAAMAERLHEIVEGSQLTWLDDLGHYPMLEGPDAWTDAVLLLSTLPKH